MGPPELDVRRPRLHRRPPERSTVAFAAGPPARAACRARGGPERRMADPPSVVSRRARLRATSAPRHLGSGVTKWTIQAPLMGIVAGVASEVRRGSVERPLCTQGAATTTNRLAFCGRGPPQEDDAGRAACPLGPVPCTKSAAHRLQPTCHSRNTAGISAMAGSCGSCGSCAQVAR